MTEAKGHGKAFLQTTIGQHPVATAVIMGILVVLILILAFYVAKYKAKASKGSFGVRSIHNLNTGGNNPLWWHGAGDAGWGGPVHRETTATQAAHYMPHLRGGSQVEHGHMHQARRHREGLATAPAAAGPCPAGMTAVTYQDVDGSMLTRCVPADYTPDMSTCKAGWDPAASAEAQALATVGSLQHDSYGERRLQGAINAAYDSNIGLTDAQLQELMHQGGTP
jgi:hypothetical protein